MTQYKVNKGVGRNALVKGMTKSYLIFFAVSIFIGYVTYIVVEGKSESTLIGLLSGVAVIGIGAGGSIFLSEKFGEKGLTHFRASKSACKYIQNKYRIRDMFADNKATRKSKK